MSQESHWEEVYKNQQTERLGWYKTHLETSVEWIKSLKLSVDDPVIDIGGGVSALAGDLLDLGFQSISVLDISQYALQLLQQRLGPRAGKVTWLTGDITRIALPVDHYRLWHDRAVFHFLTTRKHQAAYRERLLHALKVDGHLVIGTFATEAPPRCSGLPVQRYSVSQLQAAFGEAFTLKRHHKEMHLTPGGVEQMYLYCHFQRKEQS